MSEAEWPFSGFSKPLHWRPDSRGVAELPDLPPRLARFHCSVDGPWPAACSLWAQHYFNALLIPGACALSLPWPADRSARCFSPSFCAQTGVALEFDAFGDRGHGGAAEDFAARLEGHVRGVIERVAHCGRLSERMLWESAAAAFRWAAAEIAAQRPDCGARLKAIGQGGGLGPALSSAGLTGPEGGRARRKFCCLRYQLAGFPPCPAVCPRLCRRTR